MCDAKSSTNTLRLELASDASCGSGLDEQISEMAAIKSCRLPSAAVGVVMLVRLLNVTFDIISAVTTSGLCCHALISTIICS